MKSKKYFSFCTLTVCFLLLLILTFCQNSKKDIKSNYQNERKRDIRLPVTDHHYNRVNNYIADIPDADYVHASEAAYEAFRDMKYGVRIHFGIYSIWGLSGESWPFLGMSKEKKQQYQELYKEFNPVGFDADEWMELFQRVGLKCFAFTTKHHEGFSMYDTKTKVKKRVNYLTSAEPEIEDCDLAYSIMDTPFKRDIVKELCDAAHKRDIKIDLYFSHPDWYDADFRPYNYHPLQTEDAKLHPASYGHNGMWDGTVRRNKILTMKPERSPEETERLVQRHRTQIREILSNYGKIDMMCLDQWMGADIWPQMRETVKMARQLQPDVMFRARGIGNYGDYYTPEGFVPGEKSNTNMPWMVIYTLASSFSYDPDPENYKGGGWIIENLVDAVSKGGNFMVGIGPDGNGRWHPMAIKNLEEAGEWLKINGEAIYATRPRSGDVWKEGDHVRFTASKDHKTIYAISLVWPGKTLRLNTVKAENGSVVSLLGSDVPLSWHQDQDTMVIKIPDQLQKKQNRPNNLAFVFKIEN